MISRFFIDRPIFANVIAIVTIIFGLVTLRALPVEQYPQITPPTVQVSTTYPGRQRAGRRRHRRGADRAAGQRRRAHALHVVDQRQRRLVQARPSPSTSAPTSTSPRCWCRTASRSPQPLLPEEVQRPGHHHQEAVDEHHPVRHRSPRPTAATTASTSATTRRCASATS